MNHPFGGSPLYPHLWKPANSLESGKWIAPVDEGDSPQEARMWAWLYQKMADFVLRTTFPEALDGNLKDMMGGCCPVNCHFFELP
jgi:hypothetical protein